ncbi:hypothetical protein BZA77DRAFT_301052 [Pyronema omphalodes]|nr:hypothetical protein BZA77DRAFT_301052 [Pyronema omphalodes]
MSGQPPRHGRRSRDHARREEREKNTEPRNLPHHDPKHPLRGGVQEHDSDELDDPADVPGGNDEGYGAARRDFRRHAKGAAPPRWNRTATFREDGTGELQTYYGTLGTHAQFQLARQFDHRKQFLHLIGKILLRWFASFILSVAMVICFYEYEKVKILDTYAKRWFNTVSTGLYLTLGLNLAASLKGMAIIVRWKLLSRKAHDLEEVDFLLGLGSLIKVFRYGIHIIRRRPLTSLACFSWIAFNAVGRVSVALTGLTYSYDSAGATSSSPGIANVTDWTKWTEANAVTRDFRSTPQSESYAAHSYGLFSVLVAQQALTKPGEGDPNKPEFNPIERDETGAWYYYMREFNPHPKKPYSNVAHKSKRFVKADSMCSYFPMVEGQRGDSDTITYLNGTRRVTLNGISGYAPMATTWINLRPDLAINSQYNCGPRCAPLYALQFTAIDSPLSQPGAFYSCNVTISEVSGSQSPVHDMPDDIARLAAGAIALQGYSEHPNSWEFARYITDSPWSDWNVGQNQVASTDYVRRLASRFAIGAIAMKDLKGSKLAQAMGNVAWVGVLLKVKWNFLLLILGTILVLQLIVGCLVVAYANTVFCKDDSYLSTARLLRPVVERLGPSGCALTGKDISHTLKQMVVYGVRTDDTGERHHLDLGEDITKLRSFPQGWYDGYQEWEDVGEELLQGIDVSETEVGSTKVVKTRKASEENIRRPRKMVVRRRTGWVRI